MTMWLLVGGDSEVGGATYRQFRAEGRAAATTTRRPDRVGADAIQFDLSDPLDQWQPPPQTTAVVIFAAVARLAACQSDPIGSAHINVTQTLKLIERLTAAGIYVLHLSTNQVFDGLTPHMAADAPTCPVSEYGRQKARAEAGIRELLKRGAPVAVLRIAKVLSPETPLLRDWIAALSKGQPIRPFTDMVMAPTPIDLVAAAIGHLLQDRAAGFFQVTGPRDVSYADTACHLAERLAADRRLITPVSGETMNLPLGTLRPHTTLDSTPLRDRYGLAVPDAFAAVDACMAKDLAASARGN